MITLSRTGPGSDFNNYSGSNTRRILTDDYTFEDITNTRADLQHKFGRLALPVTVKTGADYRRQYRWYTVFAPNWNLVGADGVAGLNPATGRNDDNIGSFVNPNYRYSLFNNAMMPRDITKPTLVKSLQFQSSVEKMPMTMINTLGSEFWVSSARVYSPPSSK